MAKPVILVVDLTLKFYGQLKTMYSDRHEDRFKYCKDSDANCLGETLKQLKECKECMTLL